MWAVYWGTQLIGWALYLGFMMALGYVEGKYTRDLLDVALLEYGTGLGVSHALRIVILRNGWLQQSIAHVLPRLLLATLMLGLAAFIAEGILHDLLFRDAVSAFAWAPVQHFGRVVNWALLLTVWSFLYFAYSYFVQHRREEIRNLRLETASRENQLATLRAQLNPHFMFNALNGIRALVDEDPEQAKRAITQLSAILRNAMTTVKRRTVPLGEEIDIVKNYLALEAMRYEERLRVRFELDESLERAPVPPMLLQTLVENAVKHGVASLPQGGNLVIGSHRQDDKLRLSVSNSGHYEPGQVNGTGIGLRNTRRRLELLYAGKAALRIENRDGLVVTEVDLPMND
jgi:signal transduction histidine kinase